MAATLVGFTGFALRAESPELLALLPQWDSVVTLRSSVGYMDNVFLGHVDPIPSEFVGVGGEVIVLRVAPEGPQFNFFASADVQRFLRKAAEHNEYLTFSQAEVEQVFSERFKGSLSASLNALRAGTVHGLNL